ncbi:MAG: hypothetical protein MUC87_05130 [Bacteroidia bacterium]|jgi:hypothetical protein|nr:hypothetical protein [Bacteroidia bacterium]
MAIQLNHWISYNWIRNHSPVSLIHPDDIDKINFGIGLAFCFDYNEGYFHIRLINTVIRVKDFTGSIIMPSPKFQFNQIVKELERPEVVGEVDRIGYHDKDGEYFYYIRINNKVKKRRYMESELSDINV